MQAALDEVLPDVFAAAREVSRRKLEMRHFDVQLLGDGQGFIHELFRRNRPVDQPDARGFPAIDVFGREEQLFGLAGADQVLLRADRAAYVVGETMELTALTPVDGGSIYLDIVKEGQTLSTRSAPVEAGRAEFVVDLSPDLYGALELHAYKILPDGALVRDSRVVVVDEPRDLSIAISADQESYLPGDPATIDFQTTAQAGGEPVQSALGVAVVDESVFALQQQDPGFAKLYFLLEAELMEPFYQIKDFELPAAIPPDEEQVRLAQDQSAKATWAGAPVLAAPRPPTAGRGTRASSPRARPAGRWRRRWRPGCRDGPPHGNAGCREARALRRRRDCPAPRAS